MAMQAEMDCETVTITKNAIVKYNETRYIIKRVSWSIDVREREREKER